MIRGLWLLAVAMAAGAWGWNAAAAGASVDGPTYPVSQFELVYEQRVAGQPNLAELADLEVTLGVADNVYVEPGKDVPTIKVPLKALSSPKPSQFHGSALRAIAARIVEAFNQRGVIGVYVRPDEQQIDDTGRDRRPRAQTTLTLRIYTARLDRLRTVATNDQRVDKRRGINHPLHEPIKYSAPVGPGELINKQLLDEYTYLLNRHPGRRVDVAVSPSERPGGAVVDLLITENKPWTVYYQLSNTGTQSTGEWRHRLGLVHHQLTNADDILSLDVITSGEGSNAVLASYSRPFVGHRRLRWRIHGSWSDFDASDVGQANARFKGEQVNLGGQLQWNFFQHRQWFADLIGGFRYENIEVDNQVVNVIGDEDFFLLEVGGKLERQTDTASTLAFVGYERNLADLAGTDDREVINLGRVRTEAEYQVLRWSISQSVFLEPLLNHAAWADPSTPGSSTLAHELQVGFSGQYSFGDRLIPQAEQTLGGLYTVRGYDESQVAGDNTTLFTAEYRFHLPRVFAIEPDPSTTPLFGKPFRFSPQEPYGRADWDLILRGFVDVGRATLQDKQVLEEDQTLIGAGVGVELIVLRNATIRVDWATALEDAGTTQSGDSRVHFVATLLY